MQPKEKWEINCSFLRDMGIDPLEGIKYLEMKEASTIDPVHVMSLLILKQQQPIVGSSS